MASHLVNFCSLLLTSKNKLYISRLVGLQPSTNHQLRPCLIVSSESKSLSQLCHLLVLLLQLLLLHLFLRLCLCLLLLRLLLPCQHPSITELLLLQLLQTQQMNMHASHSVVPHQQAPLTPTPRVPAASLPPSPAKHQCVTLDEYCTHYDISDSDRN